MKQELKEEPMAFDVPIDKYDTIVDKRGYPMWYYSDKEHGQIGCVSKFGQTLSHTIAQYSAYKSLIEMFVMTLNRMEEELMDSEYKQRPEIELFGVPKELYFNPVYYLNTIESAIAMGETLVGADGRHRAIIFTDYKLRDKLYANHPTINWIVTDISDDESEDPDNETNRYYGAGLSTGGQQVLTQRDHKLDAFVERALIDIRPDFIFVDSRLDLPSVARSGVPWIVVNASQPLSPTVDEKLTQSVCVEVEVREGLSVGITIPCIDDKDLLDKLTEIGILEDIDKFPKLIKHI
ncbi:unnamed protein product, partial [Medioppia subpectinata]